jgi:hypothetical protein
VDRHRSSPGETEKRNITIVGGEIAFPLWRSPSGATEDRNLSLGTAAKATVVWRLPLEHRGLQRLAVHR